MNNEKRRRRRRPSPGENADAPDATHEDTWNRDRRVERSTYRLVRGHPRVGSPVR